VWIAYERKYGGFTDCRIGNIGYFGNSIETACICLLQKVEMLHCRERGKEMGST